MDSSQTLYFVCYLQSLTLINQKHKITKCNFKMSLLVVTTTEQEKPAQVNTSTTANVYSKFAGWHLKLKLHNRNSKYF